MYISTIRTCAPSQVLQSNDEAQSSRVTATQKDLVQVCGVLLLIIILTHVFMYIDVCVPLRRVLCMFSLVVVGYVLCS